MREIDYLGKRVIRWERGGSTFLAWPEGGARLMNWNVSFPDGSFRDVIHWPDLKTLDKIGSVRGGNPILFPFCGRSFDQGEIGYWQTPEGERRPMPIHGFARDRSFEIANLNANGFDARLLPEETDHERYPYRYEFTVSYRFEALALYVELRLRNHDTKPIPWAAGHHFYFTLPWAENTNREDYRIALPAKEAYRHQNGELVPLPDFPAEDTFGNPALSDRIHTGLKKNLVSFREVEGNTKVDIRIGQGGKPDRGLALVTWTEKEDSPFYCVEPWMAPPGAPRHGLGLRMVPPGKTDTFTVEIAVG